MQTIQSELALPDEINYLNIPLSLSAETHYWRFTNAIRLTRGAAEALLGTVRDDERVPGEPVALEMGSFDPKVKKYLRGHGSRTAILALLTNAQLHQDHSPRACDPEVLARVAFWHDLGKVVPHVAALLAKTDELTKDDFEVLKIHAYWGAMILEILFTRRGYGLVRNSRQWCEAILAGIWGHHERIDGEGYHKVRYGKIPPEALVVAVTDAVDVMLSGRHYQRSISPQAVIEELRRCSGQAWDHDVLSRARPKGKRNGELQFDPLVVNALVTSWPRDPETQQPLPLFRYHRHGLGHV